MSRISPRQPVSARERIAVAVALRTLARSSRVRGLGDTVAGVRLFFLCPPILKDALAGFADSLGAIGYAGTSTVLYLLADERHGFAATLVRQSSSAAIALALTARAASGRAAA